MFKFFVLLKRFAKPYKKYVVISLSLNFLSVIFSLFSFAAIIPVLRILFGLDSTTYYTKWNWNDGFTTIITALKNNLFYTVQQLIEQVGPNSALMYLGFFLVVMTLLKVSSSYFGSYFMIPIDTGVVRDLRNTLYKKIISLPIGFFSEERKGI